MPQRIARLAIAAPRRIIGFAVQPHRRSGLVFRWLTACRPGVSKIRDRVGTAIEVHRQVRPERSENADRGYGRGRRQPTCPRGRD